MRRTLDALSAADAEGVRIALKRRVGAESKEFYSSSSALIALGYR